MSTLARVMGIGLGLAVTCGAGFFVAATTPLDLAPLLGSPLAEETRRALDSALAPLRSPPEPAPLQVGFARASFTPPLGTPTLGYGARRGRGTAAVADDVFARALALRAGEAPPVVVLGADLCLWSSGLSAAVMERLPGIARERVYFGATHTHNGPGGFVHGPGVELSMGRFDPGMPGRIADAAAAAVTRAIADLGPGRIRSRTLDGDAFVSNRSKPGAPLDDELVVALLLRDDGARFALVSLSAHATAIAPPTVVTSADYPGALVRGLEARGFEGALFLAGATGQAGPVLDEGLAARGGTEAAYALGAALADAVAREDDDTPAASSSPAAREVRLATARSPVLLPPWRARVAGRGLRPTLTGWLLGQPEPVAHVHALLLGDLLLVGHSFELSAVLARQLKAYARERGLQLIPTSFNGDHAFYVVPEEDYDLEAYESGMTFFGPGLAPYLGAVSREVIDVAAGLQPPGPTVSGARFGPSRARKRPSQ